MDNTRFKILPFIEITDKRQKRRFASKCRRGSRFRGERQIRCVLQDAYSNGVESEGN